jgi:hypothetical protein
MAQFYLDTYVSTHPYNMKYLISERIIVFGLQLLPIGS